MIDLTKFEGHTPGPWRIDINRAWCFAHDHISGVHETNSETSANAWLLIGAPDLLAEVIRLRTVLERLTAASSQLTEIICVEYPDLFERGACVELIEAEHTARQELCPTGKA